MTVIGAGVIGCEYASIFGGLGAKVELINPNQSLLTFLDTEISDALATTCAMSVFAAGTVSKPRKLNITTIIW